MENQTKDDNNANIAEGSKVTLYASDFSRTGYGFVGWSLDPNAATNISAKIYGPQETITAPSYTTYGSNGLVTLYAVWVQSAGSIQNASTVSSVCSNLTTAPTDGTANISNISALTDQRDNETYAIARLADGNCWMIENLRLDLSKANITASNTNNPTQAFLTAASTSTASDNWCTDSNSGCTDQINYNVSNIGSQTTDSDSHKYDEYGVYYNWYTATAGNGVYNASGLSDTVGDICPAGWHLPTGTNTDGALPSWTGEYLGLITALGGVTALDSSNYSNLTSEEASARLRSIPNNFVYSGYYTAMASYSLGSGGEFWTSTANNDYSKAYALYFRNNLINPGTGTLNKYSGGTIRCVANPVQMPITVHYGDHVSSMLIDGEVVNDGESVELLERTTHTIAAIFDSGYVLDQWESSISSVNGADDGNITFKMSYKPETVSVSAKQGLIMQEVASWSSSVLDGQTVTAYDSRDNSKYTVARLADGKLWMTKNLRLDISNANITADNTNNPTVDFIAEASTRPITSDGSWCSSYSDECNNHIQYSTINISDSTTDSLGHTYDEYGVYYNWYTATGGNGTYSTPLNISVAGDICPKGWRLPTKTMPTMDENGDFYDLAVATKGNGNYNDSANATRFLSQPINMVESGTKKGYDSSWSVYQRGEYGSYWEAVKYDSTSYARYWNMSSSGMHDRNYGNSQINYGNTIRCLSTE